MNETLNAVVPAGIVAGLAYFVPKPEALHGHALMYGLMPWATATVFPEGANAIPYPVDGGSVAGLEYLDPKPEPLHAYASRNVPEPVLSARASPEGENATPIPSPGSVAGLAYFVPKPEVLHGYAVMYGLALWPTAMTGFTDTK